MTQESTTEPVKTDGVSTGGDEPVIKPGLFTRLANFIRSRMGKEAAEIVTTDKVELPKPEPTPEAMQTMYKYHVKIYTGAGIVRAEIEALNKDAAIYEAKIQYVRRLNVTAELYRK